ncbi:MAG: ABC transporter substrate-binding protein [Halanaerobiales bacterium]
MLKNNYFKVNLFLFSIIIISLLVIPFKVLAEDNRVIVGISEEPNTLDVHQSGANISGRVAYYLGDSLITQDLDTLDFHPGLAKDWEISEDGQTWTFYLKEGIKFHNGDELTAEDFKFTFERALDYGGVTSGKLSSLEEVEVIDDYTFSLHLDKPDATLLQSLSHAGWLHPMNKDVVEEHGEDYGQNPLSVGSYKFKSWDSGESIILEKNEEYDWAAPFYENQGSPEIDEIEFKVIPEASTQMAALETGEIDIVLLEDKDVQRFQEDSDFYILENMRLGLGMFVIFNLEKEPFDSVPVRKAINYAINKDSIVQIVKNGNAEKAYGPLPPSFWGYDEDVEEYGYNYDPDKAASILEDEGWVDSDNDGIREKDGEKMSFTLEIQSVDDWQRTAQIIQDQLKQIGIEIKIQQYEWGTLLDSLSNGNHDMSLMGYTYDGPDVLYLFLHSSQIDDGINWSFIQDDEIDSLIEEGRTTVEPDDRETIYKDLQKYIVDEAVWAPVYVDIRYTAVNNRVENVQNHPLQWLIYQDARIID